MTTTVPYIGDLDMSLITFGPVEHSNNAMKVPVYRDKTKAMDKSNKLNRLSLCDDALNPLDVRYQLDNAHNEGVPGATTNAMYRRGLTLTIKHPQTETALLALDEAIIAAACKHSKEWFRKELNEEQVRARYHPTIKYAKDTDADRSCKIKVKCPGTEYPTTLHYRDEHDCHHKNGGRIEMLTYGAKVAPIVSASYGIWFMGGGSQFGLSMQAEEMIITPGAPVEDNLSQFPSSRPLKMAKESVEGGTSADDGMPSANEPPWLKEAASVTTGILQEDAGEEPSNM